MRKYLMLTAALLYSGLAQAESLGYGDYSKEYTECMRAIPLDISDSMPLMEKCRTEEYERLQEKIKDLENTVKTLPQFNKYNNTDGLSLSENIRYREKYAELYCNMDMDIRKNSRSWNDCRLEQMNNLYIDLYNLYETAIRRK